MQDSQRRSLIFTTLDGLKESGERITAQKLASLVKMGKQTVLPFYREWQELELLGDDQELELSPELVRVLKREIGKEKFRQGEQCRELQDQLNEERDHASAQIALWRERSEQLDTELKQAQQQTIEQEQQNTTQQRELQAQFQRITSLEQQLQNLKQNEQKLEIRLKEETDRSSQALRDQEKRLDEAHQKIIDHWLKVVDGERQDKIKLGKQLDKLTEHSKQQEQGNLQLQASLTKEQDRTASLSEKLSQAEQGRDELETVCKDHSQLLHLLGEINEPHAEIKRPAATGEKHRIIHTALHKP